jgi:1,4-dihydroxy-2-naphthoyl-CoA synthase
MDEGRRMRGTSPQVEQAARALRRDMTDAEKRLWKALRKNRQDGFYFRRQHPIERFVVDFCCTSRKLCIEVDGGIHDTQRERDAEPPGGGEVASLRRAGGGAGRRSRIPASHRPSRSTLCPAWDLPHSGAFHLPMTTKIRAAELRPTTFSWRVDGPVATVTLSRPERKNPLTFESYAELRDTFRQLAFATDVKVVVITGEGGNFCSGGDVHEIIGPLVRMREERRMDELLAFTRMTGDLVKAIRACPQPIIAAIDGVCVGAGAILAMASDLRLGTARSKVAFLFTKVGLSGADMGACAILPRIIGQGRASELLFTGRTMAARRPSAGASTTASSIPRRCGTRRARWRPSWRPAPPSRTA